MTKVITKVIAGLGIVAGLGVAALPLSSYAAEAFIPVQVTVGSAAGITTPGGGTGCGTTIDITPSTIGTTVGTGFCNITASTNDDNGYTLQIDSSSVDVALGTYDATNNLVSDAAPHTDVIGPVSTAWAGDLTGGTGGFSLAGATSVSAWGFNVYKGATLTPNTSLFFAVPAAATTLDSTSAISSNNYTFTFGATVATTQAQGTYNDLIKLTVTNN